MTAVWCELARNRHLKIKMRNKKTQREASPAIDVTLSCGVVEAKSLTKNQGQKEGLA